MSSRKPDSGPFVSRGGLKLRHALDAFAIDVTNWRCADFGANVGGFTDCLLQAGAAHVWSIDTGYGVLAYKLRIDVRVTVMERTNALHAERPQGGVDLVVVDMAWTPQSRCIPATIAWLSSAPTSRIITLIKPHYEAKGFGLDHLLVRGVLNEADAEAVMQRVVESLPSLGVRVLNTTRSPIEGGSGGNTEYLALLERA